MPSFERGFLAVVQLGICLGEGLGGGGTVLKEIYLEFSMYSYYYHTTLIYKDMNF